GFGTAGQGLCEQAQVVAHVELEAKEGGTADHFVTSHAGTEGTVCHCRFRTAGHGLGGTGTVGRRVNVAVDKVAHVGAVFQEGHAVERERNQRRGAVAAIAGPQHAGGAVFAGSHVGHGQTLRHVRGGGFRYPGGVGHPAPALIPVAVDIVGVAVDLVDVHG